MKSNIPICIAISLLTFMLSSCEDACKGIRIRSYHFIDCYEEWSSFDLRYNNADEIFSIRFKTKQKYYSAEFQGLFNPTQTVEDLNKFNELAAKNNDVGYNWEDIYIYHSTVRTAIYPKVTDILITSDRDYDESHPAGTPLNDIFMAYYHSFTQFLGNVDHSDIFPNHYYLGETRKPCNEIEKDELSVISPSTFAIYPKHSPTAWTGKHKITVTLTDENGNTHSQTAETDLSDFKRFE